MKKFFIAFLAAASLAFAMEVGSWGGFSFTGLLSDLEELNSTLADIDQDLGGGGNLEFTSPLFVLGGEGGLRFGVLTVSAWGGGFSKQAWGDTTYASLGYGMGYAEVGVQWDPARWLSIRPAVELGGAGLELEIRERYGGFGGPDDTLYEPYRYAATAGQGNIGGSLAVQFNIPVGERGYVGISLKGGYLYPVIKPRWHDFEGERIASPAPSFGINGPFLTLGVNLGARGQVTRYPHPPDEGWDDL